FHVTGVQTCALPIYSVLPEWVNAAAALAALSFFAFAIGTYVLHGLLQDTDNQLRRPHRLGQRLLPPWLTGAFMLLLIVGEVGGRSEERRVGKERRAR